MKHKMRLNDEPFKMIKQGLKTIELRLYDEKRKQISVGDEIEFTNVSDLKSSLICTVVGIHVFSSFKELYKSLPLLKCGYTLANIESASADDMNKYYSTEEQNRYGVVGIEIKLI